MEVSREDIKQDELMTYPVSERFLKLSIENYLRIIEIDPNNPQIALINAINNPKYRFVTAVLARRTGKSFIANVIAQLVLLIPDTQVLIMAPNYSLSKVSWDIQKKLIRKFDLEVERCNEKDKELVLKNGSCIRMGSISRADSVVGRSYDLILFDEAALDDKGEAVFNTQLLPTLDKPNAKAIFISTPRGKNYFYDFYKKGFSDDFPTWATIRSTWRDNPRINIDVINDAKRACSKAEFDQEYNCSFITLEGQIWDLNRECIIDVSKYGIKVLDTIAGLDLGFKDYTAFVVIQTDGYNFFIVEEYFEAGKSTAQHAEVLNRIIDKWDIDFIYIDSAAAQTKYDLAYSYDISTINAQKSILDGIGYVSSLIDNNRLFIDKSCKNTIDAVDNYAWDGRENLLKEKPLHNIYCHIPDAIRYAVYSHNYNVDPAGYYDEDQALIKFNPETIETIEPLKEISEIA